MHTQNCITYHCPCWILLLAKVLVPALQNLWCLCLVVSGHIVQTNGHQCGEGRREADIKLRQRNKVNKSGAHVRGYPHDSARLWAHQAHGDRNTSLQPTLNRLCTLSLRQLVVGLHCHHLMGFDYLSVAQLFLARSVLLYLSKHARFVLPKRCEAYTASSLWGLHCPACDTCTAQLAALAKASRLDCPTCLSR